MYICMCVCVCVWRTNTIYTIGECLVLEFSLRNKNVFLSKLIRFRDKISSNNYVKRFYYYHYCQQLLLLLLILSLLLLFLL